MSNIYKINKANREKNFFQIGHEEVKFKDLLYSSLRSFFSNPCDGMDPAPKEWTPIFLYGVMAQFDPYMMNGTQARHYSDGGEKWSPWLEFNGIKRTKWFLEKYYDRFTDISNITLSKLDAFRKQDIIFKYFMYTIEFLSDKEIILSILCRKTNSIKRILIKDIRAVCSLLSTIKGDFPRILGSQNEKQINFNPIGKNTKLFEYLEDGSAIPYQDENIYEIHKHLNYLKTKVYYIS